MDMGVLSVLNLRVASGCSKHQMLSEVVEGILIVTSCFLVPLDWVIGLACRLLRVRG